MSDVYYADKFLRGSSDFVMADKSVAYLVGLDAAVFLQVIEGWCRYNEDHNKIDHFIDGHWWTYNTYEAWLKELPFFRNTKKINRMVAELENLGYLASLTPTGWNRTKWYRVNKEFLSSKLIEFKKTQSQSESQESTNSAIDLTKCVYKNGQNVESVSRQNVESSDDTMSTHQTTQCRNDLYTINKQINNQEREEQDSHSQELSAHLDMPKEDDPFQGYIPIRSDADWHYNQSKHKLFPWRISWTKRAYDRIFCAWLIDNAPGVAARCKDIGRAHGMADAIQWLTNKEYKEDGLLELIDLWDMYQAKDEVEIKPEIKTDSKPDTQTYLNQNGFSNLWNTESNTWSEAAKEAALTRVNSDRRHDTKLSSRDALEVDYWLADRVQYKDLANLAVVSEQADKVKPWVDKEYQAKRFYAFQKKAREITDFRVVPCEASDQTDNLKPIMFTYWCTLDGREPVKHVPFNEHDAKYLLGEWVSITKQYREHLASLANVG